MSLNPSDERSSRVTSLLSYLVENQGSVTNSDDLAKRFQLEPEFVQSVIADLTGRAKPTSFERKANATNWLELIQSHGVLPTLLLSMVAFHGLSLYSLARSSPETLAQAQVTTVLWFVALMFCNGLIYNRVAKMRVALLGTVFLMATTIISNIASVFLLKHKTAVEFPGFLFVIALATLYNGTIYGGVAWLCTAMGSLRRAKREEIEASRHDLLQRYFDLIERLRVPGTSQPPSRLERASATFRLHPYAWSFWSSTVISLLTVGIFKLAGFDPYSAPSASTISNLNLVLVISYSLFMLGYYVLLAFLAGSARRAVLVSLTISLAGMIVSFTTLQFTSKQSLLDPSFLLTFAVSTLACAVLAAAVGAATKYVRRNLRQLRIEQNDEATLASELVQLQWRLAERASVVNILVADVVGSTKMKADADLLAAEFSFREYQEWVAEVCHLHAGSVMATAGDGTIIAFTHAENALAAAKDLLAKLDSFNAEKNRLQMPFRIRLAMHAGKVTGAVQEVMFAEVIDVAAHLERASEVNSYVASEAFARLVPVDSHIASNEVIDGQRIFRRSYP